MVIRQKGENEIESPYHHEGVMGFRSSMANAYSSFINDVNQTKTVLAYIAVATGRATWSVSVGGDDHRTRDHYRARIRRRASRRWATRGPTTRVA